MGANFTSPPLLEKYLFFRILSRFNIVVKFPILFENSSEKLFSFRKTSQFPNMYLENQLFCIIREFQKSSRVLPTKK